MDRNEAYDAILDRLPPSLALRPHDARPGDQAVVHRRHRSEEGGRRGPPPASVEGTGADEVAALVDLAQRLAAR